MARPGGPEGWEPGFRGGVRIVGIEVAYPRRKLTVNCHSRPSAIFRLGQSFYETVFIDELSISVGRNPSGPAAGLFDTFIMSTKLFVGNLSFGVSEDDLREMFSAHGPVNEINVIKDRMTGRSRGFAFVTMNSEEGAKAVIAALHGKDLKGRSLTVNEARPR